MDKQIIDTFVLNNLGLKLYKVDKTLIGLLAGCDKDDRYVIVKMTEDSSLEYKVMSWPYSKKNKDSIFISDKDGTYCYMYTTYCYTENGTPLLNLLK